MRPRAAGFLHGTNIRHQYSLEQGKFPGSLATYLSLWRFSLIKIPRIGIIFAKILAILGYELRSEFLFLRGGLGHGKKRYQIRGN